MRLVSESEEAVACVVCTGDLVRLSAELNLYQCAECEEVQQMVDGVLRPIKELLSRNQLGDDRVHAAVSRPHVSDIASFIETFENATRMWHMDLAAASGSLRTVMAQIENRLDFALKKFAALGLVDNEASEGLRMLREARELVSTLPARKRGITP